MSLRQRGQRPSEATNEGGYYGGGQPQQQTPQTPHQQPRSSPPSSGGGYGGAGYYGTPSASAAGYGAAPAANAPGYGYPAATPVQQPAAGYNATPSSGYGAPQPQGYNGQSYGASGGGGGYAASPSYGGYSGGGGGSVGVSMGIGSGGAGSNPYHPKNKSSSSGFTVKHVLLSLLVLTLLVLTGTAFHYRGLMKATQIELDNARRFLSDERGDDNKQRREEKKRNQKPKAKNAAEEKLQLEHQIGKLEHDIKEHQKHYGDLTKQHAAHTQTLEKLESSKQDLLKAIDHTKYQLEDAVEETEMYKSMVDGMDEMEEWMKKREGALNKRIEVLEGKIRQESWREAAEWFGPGPHRVALELEYPDVQDGVDSANWPLVRNTLTIDLAPLDQMSHTVNHFLQQVHHGLWDGCNAVTNARHILQLGPTYSDEEKEEAHYDRFYDMGLDKVSYQEYNPKHPHTQWTVGLAGRPGGPDFYVNKVDNSVIHGPGGQVNEDDMHNEADPCFGRVVDSDPIIQGIEKIPTDPKESFKILHPVKIVSSKVLVPQKNAADGWREIPKGEKLDGGDDDAKPMATGGAAAAGRRYAALAPTPTTMASDADDIIPEATRAAADLPPPPPPPSTPASPLVKTPSGEFTAASSSFASSPSIDHAHVEHEPPSSPALNAAASPLISPPLLVEIEEGTPAAEALRANADVRVSRLRKAGRSTRLQAGVRAVKAAARTASGQPGHAGDRRGAPAFVAPPGSQTTLAASGVPPPTIPEAEDEGSEHGAAGSLARKPMDDGASEDGMLQRVERDEDSASKSGPVDGLDESEHSYPQTVFSSNVPSIVAESLMREQHPVQRHTATAPPGAALPAAIAAACRAGEELDRQRATQVDRADLQRSSSEGGMDAGSVQKAPLTPLTSLFKSPAPVPNDDDSNASPFRPVKVSPRPRPLGHKRSASVPLAMSSGSQGGSQGLFHTGVFRRTSMEPIHQMPSEISVAETEKHANLRHDAVEEDLSDDEEAEIRAIKKHVQVDPIVVEVPGSRHVTIEETKEEEGAEGEEEDKRAVMAKAKKKKSGKSKKKHKHHLDDEAFHFHGPKSVRRWVARRRLKEEQKKQRSYVKGKVIDREHELYTMSIAVMFGMRTSIGRTNESMSRTTHNERRWLENEDLMAVEKYEFPPRGSDLTPPHQLNHTFKFKDYSPLAFAYLRRMFGVNEFDFLLSVCGSANYIEFQSNAKSGQFFFYSPDGKYMIKTMTNTESKFLRRIMPHYFRHCAQNPNTLVTKFLGMYRVKLYHLKRNVKFVVMKSVYDTDKFLHQLFDVKGSTTGRDAKPSDAVKKDNDIRRMLPDGAFVLDPNLRQRLRTQVEQDCDWLKSMKIMDYSMLIGVHNISHRTTKKPLTSAVQPVRAAASTDDGDDRSNSSIDASAATLDRFLDVDDDDSYLEGVHYKGGKVVRVARQSSASSDVVKMSLHHPDEAIRAANEAIQAANADDDSTKETETSVERAKEKAIEDIYWPFHRYYDMKGRRRIEPIRESLVPPEPTKDSAARQSEQHKPEEKFLKGLCLPKADAPMNSGVQYHLPAFERPLSYRKDGGFMMDTANVDLPLKMSVPGAPHMHEYCDGKIFYMGIIDILQQFNIRKRGEARYRRLGGKGWDAASCVHPNLYADRFLRFFDEYTEGAEPSAAKNETTSVASDSASRTSNASELPVRVKTKAE
ncbi:hypothetical protein ACHAXT_007113 [Thalassiosira profunda]